MATLPPQNDLQAIADSRVIEQYKNSPKLRAVIALLIAEFTEAQVAAFELAEAFDVDTASTWVLDIIGRHVGLPRPIIDAGLFDFFGYQGAPNAKGYGKIGFPAIGGRYLGKFTATTGMVPMVDIDYRVHIKAKVVRNRGDGTPEDILAIVRLVLPNPGTTLIENTLEAHLKLTLGRNLSTIEKAYFTIDDLTGTGDRLVPRCAGTSIEYHDQAGPI